VPPIERHAFDRDDAKRAEPVGLPLPQIARPRVALDGKPAG